MEQKLCLSEEHRCGDSHSDSDIPEITFRPFKIEQDMFFMAELYWAFCHKVNGEDVSKMKQFDWPDGSKVEVTEAEARIYAFLHKGCRIQVAFVKNVMAGFLLYHELFENIISIRSCFIESWAIDLKLGKGLINSLQPIPKNLIFQTRKGAPPDRLLKVTEPFRVRVAEDENFITWSMTWRSNDLHLRNSDSKPHT